MASAVDPHTTTPTSRVRDTAIVITCQLSRHSPVPCAGPLPQYLRYPLGNAAEVMGTEARLLRRIKDFTTGSDLGEWIAKGVESRKGISGLTIVKALEGLDYGISACCLHLGNVDVEASAEDLEAVSGVPEYSVEPKRWKRSPR